MYDNSAYKIEGYETRPQRWFCPNCAALLSGSKGSDGKIRIKCPKCKVWTTKYRENRQVDIIEIRIPESCIY